jgi:hypothetical protein
VTFSVRVPVDQLLFDLAAALTRANVVSDEALAQIALAHAMEG